MTDTNHLPVELQKGYEAVTKANDRAIRNGGYGQSNLGIKIKHLSLRLPVEYAANPHVLQGRFSLLGGLPFEMQCPGGNRASNAFPNHH